MLRATSFTRVKARDHCNVRALISRKGGDRPSSFRTRRRRPKEKCVVEMSTGTWQVVNKGALSAKTCVSPPSRGRHDANSDRPW